ncbi:hypothetical protein Tco_1174965 [Tanacetum coccineum]
MTVINANAFSNFVSLRCLSSLLNALLQNTMAEQNIPAQPPTRTDEQIVPRSQWLTIGKSNLLFNALKDQKEPIFQISWTSEVYQLLPALTASAMFNAIHLQQFWKTMSFNDKTRVYSCQLDELWFDLSADLLRKALAIILTTSSSILYYLSELLWEEFIKGSDFFSLKASHRKEFGLEIPQEKGEGEGDNADLERAIKLSLDPAFLPQGRAPVGGVTIRDPKKETTDQFYPCRRDQFSESTTGPSSRSIDDTSEKVIHESSSTSDSERIESDTESGAPKGDKVQGEIVSSTSHQGKIHVSDLRKLMSSAGNDLSPCKKTDWIRSLENYTVSLAGPNHEHMDDEFIVNSLPKDRDMKRHDKEVARKGGESESAAFWVFNKLLRKLMTTSLRNKESEAMSNNTISSSTGCRSLTQRDEGNVSDMEDTDILSHSQVPEEQQAIKEKRMILVSFIKWFADENRKEETLQSDLEGPAFTLVNKAFTKNSDYYFKEDYTIVPKPRAVVYRDRNEQRKLMRLNELHKFSDGTLTRVMEKLGPNEDDREDAKTIITAIEKRLQIRRYLSSLESFVGGLLYSAPNVLKNSITEAHFEGERSKTQKRSRYLNAFDIFIEVPQLEFSMVYGKGDMYLKEYPYLHFLKWSYKVGEVRYDMERSQSEDKGKVPMRWSLYWNKPTMVLVHEVSVQALEGISLMMEWMEIPSSRCQDEGKTDKVDEKRESTAQQQSTDRQDEDMTCQKNMNEGAMIMTEEEDCQEISQLMVPCKSKIVAVAGYKGDKEGRYIVVKIMETKSFISKLDKVSSPEGNYLVVYRVNGNFKAFNYLIKLRVQIPQNNLDNLRSTEEEEDGATEVLDPRDVPGSILLEIIDFAILGLLLEPLVLDLVDPAYSLEVDKLLVVCLVLFGKSLDCFGDVLDDY